MPKPESPAENALFLPGAQPLHTIACKPQVWHGGPKHHVITFGSYITQIQSFMPTDLCIPVADQF